MVCRTPVHNTIDTAPVCHQLAGRAQHQTVRGRKCRVVQEVHTVSGAALTGPGKLYTRGGVRGPASSTAAAFCPITQTSPGPAGPAMLEVTL